MSRVVIHALALALGCIVGCGEEIPDLRGRVELLERELRQKEEAVREAQSDAAAARQQVAGIEERLEQCRHDAEISDPIVLYDAAREAFEIDERATALAKLRRFVELYPRHDNVRAARRRIRSIEGEIEAARIAATLADVTMAEIEADIDRYRGKVIDRDVHCHAIREAFALAGDRNSACTVQRDNGDLRVFYTADQERELASRPRSRAGFFDYRGRFRILDREVYGGGVVGQLVEVL